MRSVFHSKVDVSPWRLVLGLSFARMFLTVKHYFSEPFLVSIFALFVSRSHLGVLLSPGPPVNFRMRTNFDVRFDSLDFFTA